MPGQVVVDAGAVMRAPDSFSTHEAAAFMEATITAYLNIFHIGGAKKGSSVLIHGVGSGVGRRECCPDQASCFLCKVTAAPLFKGGSPEIRVMVFSVQSVADTPWLCCSQAIVLCKAAGITSFVTAGRCATTICFAGPSHFFFADESCFTCMAASHMAQPVFK